MFDCKTDLIACISVKSVFSQQWGSQSPSVEVPESSSLLSSRKRLEQVCVWLIIILTLTDLKPTQICPFYQNPPLGSTLFTLSMMSHHLLLHFIPLFSPSDPQNHELFLNYIGLCLGTDFSFWHMLAIILMIMHLPYWQLDTQNFSYKITK